MAGLTVGDQRRHWQARSAAYVRWAEPTERMADRFNLPLLEAAGVAAGDRLIDLASGAGEPALTAARLVGPQGFVLATDLSEAMLAEARRRAAAKGFSWLATAVCDAGRLPLADGGFDRATCRFGLMFMPDPVASLAAVRRALRPGGTAAFMVWGGEADNPLQAAIGAAIAAVLGRADDIHGTLRLRFAEAGRLAAAFTAAGFAGVAEHVLGAERKAAAPDRFWAAPLDLALGRPATAEEEAALAPAILDRLSPWREGGLYRLPVLARYATGTA